MFDGSCLEKYAQAFQERGCILCDGSDDAGTTADKLQDSMLARKIIDIMSMYATLSQARAYMVTFLHRFPRQKTHSFRPDARWLAVGAVISAKRDSKSEQNN